MMFFLRKVMSIYGVKVLSVCTKYYNIYSASMHKYCKCCVLRVGSWEIETKCLTQREGVSAALCGTAWLYSVLNGDFESGALSMADIYT